MPDDDSRSRGGHLQRAGASGGESRAMRQTTLTIAALVVVFAIAAVIVLSALTMGAVAGT